ncbi:MAG: hypothetical protein GY722_24755, partial [bacterium]|nr:hypothetical protein [bacterium]
MSWGEDHGVFRQVDCEPVEVDLSPYAGLSGLMLRWRYADPGAFAWYAQIDDVGVVCDQQTCGLPPVTGGIESGSPWTVASARFATPLCTSTSCGVTAARSGDGWVFLGGAEDGPEQASVEQAVPLPEGLATLSFHLWVPQASGNGSDAFRVLLDGQEIFTAGEGE